MLFGGYIIISIVPLLSLVAGQTNKMKALIQNNHLESLVDMLIRIVNMSLFTPTPSSIFHGKSDPHHCHTDGS